MAYYILDKAYKITDAGGTEAYRVLVQDTNAGEATKPGAANAGGILGVTVHAQSNQNQTVAVRKAGIARVEASGAVSVGDPINIDGVTGKVKTVDEAATTKINCLGFAETAAAADGDLIEVFISIHEREAV